MLLIVLLGVTTYSVVAYYNEGNWIESTCYWESTCFVFSFIRKSDASGSSQQINASVWQVYDQNFGGTVYPKQSWCGTSEWLKQSAYWVDSGGNHSITGWVHNGAVCNPDVDCDNYYSLTDYTLVASPVYGVFNSSTLFGYECLPAAGSSTSVVVYP